MSVLVGIDVGTSAVKAVAIDPEGSVLATEEAPLSLDTPRAGWAEQNPEDWWAACQDALGRVRSACGEAPAGIGLTGQMHGLVALDDHDQVIRPAILWNDQRSFEECGELEAAVGGRERLVAMTGNRAVPGFTAPKLLWLRAHEPDAFARVRRVMLPKDYVRLRLCGAFATDVADASGTLLLDVGHRAWSAEVLEALELDGDWLPPARESVAVTGHTEDGVPVAAGAGDQAAGALGVGVVDPGMASVVLGSSGVVFAATEGFEADAEGRVHAFCHAVPDSWHAMGVMLSAAAALSWFRAIAGEPSYDELLAGAERWEPGADGLTFLPYLSGERTPYVDPDARGAFVGLQARHDTGALARAVLEGVAFGLRDSLDLLRSLGAPIELGRVSGGGARSELWLRIVASVLELPLERVAVDEGAAFGAALLGGVAAEVWSDPAEAVAATVRGRAVVEPVAEWTEVYRERRETYRALYPALP